MAPLLLFMKPSIRIVTAFTPLVPKAVCAKTAPARKTAVRSIAVSFFVIEAFSLDGMLSAVRSLPLPNREVRDEIRERNEGERQYRHHPQAHPLQLATLRRSAVRARRALQILGTVSEIKTGGQKHYSQRNEVRPVLHHIQSEGQPASPEERERYGKDATGQRQKRQERR